MSGLAVQLGLVAVLILLNAVFTASEMALLSLGEARVARLAGRGRAGKALAHLTNDPNRFLATTQVGITRRRSPDRRHPSAGAGQVEKQVICA